MIDGGLRSRLHNALADLPEAVEYASKRWKALEQELQDAAENAIGEHWKLARGPGVFESVNHYGDAVVFRVEVEDNIRLRVWVGNRRIVEAPAHIRIECLPMIPSLLEWYVDALEDLVITWKENRDESDQQPPPW